MAKKYEFVVSAMNVAYEKTIWEDGSVSESTVFRITFGADMYAARYLFEGTLAEVMAEAEALKEKLVEAGINASINVDMYDKTVRKPAGFKAATAKSIKAFASFDKVKDYTAAA